MNQKKNDRQRNILILHGYKDRGGSAKHSYILSRGLKNHSNFVPFVIRPHSTSRYQTSKLEEEGISYFTLPLKNKLHFFLNIIKLIFFVRNHDIELINPHLKNAIVIGSIVGLLANVPVIATLHGLPSDYMRGVGIRDKFFDFLLGMFIKYGVSKSIAISNYTKRVNTKLLHINPDRITIIHNCTDEFEIEYMVDESNYKRELGVEEEDFIVASIGRLSVQKGMHKFIRMAKIILRDRKDIRFLIFGEGEMRGYLEKKIEEEKLNDYIKLMGYRKDIDKIYNVVDVLTITALNEAFGRTTLEAMLMGKPVVAFDSGGVSEIIVDGKTGFLVPPEDIGLMAEKIIYLIDNEEEKKNFGKEGRKRVKEKFSEEQFIFKHIELLTDILNR